MRMKKIKKLPIVIIAFFIVLLVCTFTNFANFQVGVKAASSPTLDTHGQTNNDAASVTLSITTTGSSDIIYAAAYVPFTTGTFSISDNTGTLTWKRARECGFPFHNGYT